MRKVFFRLYHSVPIRLSSVKMASVISNNRGISDVTQSVPTTNRPLSRNPRASLYSLDEQQKNDTLVSMQELIPTQIGSSLEVESGIILKLLDIASCLSAEKHARKPCVTVTLDDLIFENKVKAGDIVHFTAKVGCVVQIHTYLCTLIYIVSGLSCIHY